MTILHLITSVLFILATPAEVYDCMKELGYSDFRKGQEAAIMRILSGNYFFLDAIQFSLKLFHFNYCYYY